MSLRRTLLGLSMAVLVVAARPVSADSTKYLPNNTEAVININVKQILGAAAIKQQVEQAKQGLLKNEEVFKILNDLGFDPFRDVNRVIVGMKDQEQALILVEGKFNKKKFADLARKAAGQEENFEIIKQGGHTLYKAAVNQGQVDSMYMAVVDNSTMAAGPSASMVVEALDKAAGKVDSKQKKSLLQLLSKANPNQSMSIVAFPSNLGGDTPAELQKISSITGGMTLTADLKIEVTLNAKNADDAKDLKTTIDDGLRQGKALLAILATQNPDLAILSDIVGGLSVDSSGKSISLVGRVTEEMMKKLQKLGQQQ